MFFYANRDLELALCRQNEIRKENRKETKISFHSFLNPQIRKRKEQLKSKENWNCFSQGQSNPFTFASFFGFVVMNFSVEF